LENEPDLDRLRKYRNRESLSSAEKSELIKLCKERSPDVLKSKYNHHKFDPYLS